MQRRTFLGFTGLAAFGLFSAACAARIEPEEPSDGSAPGDAGSDAHVRDAFVADARPPTGDGSGPAAFVVREAFTVLLNDTTCSGHSHTVRVSPARYADDAPVTFMHGAGSHELTFLPSELERLERGERVPFSTTGAGGGHSHCGTAWRTSVGPEDRTLADACQPRNPVPQCVERR